MVDEDYPKAAALAEDESLARAVRELIPRVHEFSTFLVHKLGVEDMAPYFPHRVTFHPTCHSQRILRIGNAPSGSCEVRGIDLVELPHADECCGLGGTFSVKNADTSIAMLSDKVRCVLDTGAEYCAAADNSCLMHIGGSLHRHGRGKPDPPRRDPRRDRRPDPTNRGRGTAGGRESTLLSHKVPATNAELMSPTSNRCRPRRP